MTAIREGGAERPGWKGAGRGAGQAGSDVDDFGDPLGFCLREVLWEC